MAILVNTPRWSGPACAVAGALAGVFLMVAPSLFAYLGTPAETSHRIAGPLLALFWIIAAWDITRSVRWWTLPAAAWLLIEPLVLRDTAPAAASAIAVALISVAAVLLAHDGDVAAKYAGGWMSLAPGRGAGDGNHRGHRGHRAERESRYWIGRARVADFPMADCRFPIAAPPHAQPLRTRWKACVRKTTRCGPMWEGCTRR